VRNTRISVSTPSAVRRMLKREHFIGRRISQRAGFFMVESATIRCASQNSRQTWHLEF
jgi:hypothetical protein